MRKPCREKKDTKKAGAWSKKEDEMLVDYVRIHGEGCGRSLPQPTGRCGKSCKRRWINYTRPDLKTENFGEDEDDLIIKLHALLGNRWSLIAGRLPGRTDNEVEKYWNSHLKRKLISMGIDPNNHRINHTLPRRSKNQISDVSNSDDDSCSCATSAVSKALNNYHGQSKTGNIELYGTGGKKAIETDLRDLNIELMMMNSNSHAASI